MTLQDKERFKKMYTFAKDIASISSIVLEMITDAIPLLLIELQNIHMV